MEQTLEHLAEMVPQGDSMKLSIIVATMKVEGYDKRHADWIVFAGDPDNIESVIIDNSVTNRGLMESYQEGYRKATGDILAFIHDDVEITESGWDERVLREFEDPQVGVVGFGGAVQHGSDDIYKVPYKLAQLGRFGYKSNMKDAEIHGERFKGECDVATIDGFSIVVRRSLLDSVGGWPVGTPVGYIGYDYWITLNAKRFGYKTRLVGVECHHLGGLTAVKAGVTAAPNHHAEAHQYLYDSFADVLPVHTVL